MVIPEGDGHEGTVQPLMATRKRVAMPPACWVAWSYPKGMAMKAPSNRSWRPASVSPCHAMRKRVAMPRAENELADLRDRDRIAEKAYGGAGTAELRRGRERIWEIPVKNLSVFLCVFLCVLLLVLAAGPAQGGAPDTVPVGNPGNEADGTTFGAVAYAYRIGKYEVTNAQYCEFLNAVARTDTCGLYKAGMAGEYGGITRSGASGKYTYAVKDGMGSKPVGSVSWYDALRYANWLTNGRGKGATETGSYTFTRQGGRWKVTMPDHAALAARKVTQWVLASENEWYKAAYYDPGKPGGAGYWVYATKSDKAPASCYPPGKAPAANYNISVVTDVGAYRDSASAYGTFDQNGNMWEWNETQGGGKCGVRGGSFYLNDHEGYLRSATRYVSNPPTFEFCNYGIRVVALGGAGSRSSPSAPVAKIVDTVKTPTVPKRTIIHINTR